LLLHIAHAHDGRGSGVGRHLLRDGGADKVGVKYGDQFFGELFPKLVDGFFCWGCCAFVIRRSLMGNGGVGKGKKVAG
jgi:hypothetical protein